MHLCELDASDESIRQAHREARDSLGSNCISDRLEETLGSREKTLGNFRQKKKKGGGGGPPINFLSPKDIKNTTQMTRSQLTTFIMFPQASTLYGVMQIYFSPLFFIYALVINQWICKQSKAMCKEVPGAVMCLLLLETNSITLRYSSVTLGQLLEFWVFEIRGRNETDSTQLGINGRMIH